MFIGDWIIVVDAFIPTSPSATTTTTTTTTTTATNTVGISTFIRRRRKRQEGWLRRNHFDGGVRCSFSVVDSSDQDKAVVEGRTKEPKERTEHRLHNVDGVICREVVNTGLPLIESVTVLEATAESQEMLVDEVLLLEDEIPKDDIEGERRRIEHGDPYGAVLWPASWAVAKYLLSEEEETRQLSGRNGDTTSTSTDTARRGLTFLSDTHFIEIGTGTGLVSLALAKAGTQRIVATDYEPLPLKLVTYAATECVNDELQQRNKVPRMTRIETQLFDICDFDTPIPTLSTSQSQSSIASKIADLNPCNNRLVVAADIMYEPVTGRAMARRVHEALRSGARVVVGDSPGRAGRAAFLEELQKIGGIPADLCQFNRVVNGRRCIGPRHDLICGEGSTSVVDPDEDSFQELSVAILDLSPSDLIQQKMNS